MTPNAFLGGRLKSVATFSIFGILFLLSNLSFGASVSIMMPAQGRSGDAQKIVQKPAADLIQDGRVLEVGEAASLSQGGVDLSLLNPQENKLWQNQSYKTSDADQQFYPKTKEGVRYTSFEATNFGTAMARVESVEKPGTYFRLAISRFSQSVMMRAALLRKLGFYLPSPQYYSSLRINFKDENEKKDFLEEAQKFAGDFESRKWLLEDNKDLHFVTLSSATLEVVSNDFFDIQWGFAPNPDDPRQKPLVDRLSRNRAYRALILPYALVDVPESVNRFSAQMILIQAGFAVLQQVSAKSFSACSYEDFRWILRRLQSLTLKDYQEIVREAHYPAEIEPLVLGKLLYRADEALKIFQLQSSIQLPDLNITSSSGLVKKGKVTQEFVPGYPQRFSHGERTSPYQEGDLARYLSVNFNSSLLETVVSRLNTHLQAQTVSDIATNYQQNKIQKIMDWFKNGGSPPKFGQVESFSGPVGGLSFAASRNVATGTYSGSTAPVQLVDNVSMGGSIGYFVGLDGLRNYFPSLQGNLQYVRDYTHVRPILSITEGTKVSWKDVLVPQFMGNLVGILKSEETSVTDKDGKALQQKSLDKFLSDLRDGEVFTVTDSLMLGIGIQAQASLDVLLGLTPFNFINSVTLGADASRVILRQISFAKTGSGVQIFVREMNNRGAGLEMNLSFYLKMLKIRAQSSAADINTQAFVIDYDPSIAAESDATSEKGKIFAKTRENLRLALHPLFKSNETELLYSKFKNNKFALEHNIKTNETKLQFLAARFSSFEEEHLLKIQYPTNEAHPELDPKDEEVTLYSYKKGQLKGRDLLGMFFDILDGVFAQKKQDITLTKAMGDNPANMPLGNAYWTQVNTESDLTANGKQYPSVAQIQHVWGGWSMSRDKFFKLVDQIQSDFSTTEIANYPLIKKEALLNMKSLDFYRITANLSVLENGVERIKQLLLQADAESHQVKKPRFFLTKFFQKLSELGGKARAEDKELFTDVMTILGNGDQRLGTAKYTAACQEVNTNKETGLQTPGFWLYGSNYECLSDWMRKLIELSRSIPKDKTQQTRWMTKVLEIMDEQIPLPQLLKFLGNENYLFFVRVNGFRAGDEDGDLEFYSNTVGDPAKNYDYAGGLFQLYAKKTRIIPVEIDRTQGGYQ